MQTGIKENRIFNKETLNVMQIFINNETNLHLLVGSYKNIFFFFFCYCTSS